MSLDLLGDLTKDDATTQKILFDKGEVIEFICKDTRVDEHKGHIFIKCVIASGLHEGKDYDIMIPGGAHEATRKRRAMFFFKSGFWTEEELANRNIQLSRLVGRRLQGKASKVTESNGEKYQNIDDIKDSGESVASVSELANNVGF